MNSAAPSPSPSDSIECAAAPFPDQSISAAHPHTSISISKFRDTPTLSAASHANPPSLPEYLPQSNAPCLPRRAGGCKFNLSKSISPSCAGELILNSVPAISHIVLSSERTVLSIARRHFRQRRRIHAHAGAFHLGQHACQRQIHLFVNSRQPLLLHFLPQQRSKPLQRIGPLARDSR